MAWDSEQITKQALDSALVDYAAIEAIGLDAIGHARVLDVGCFDGFGTYLRFASHRRIETIVGIDPFGGALDRAKERYGDERFSFIESSFEDYPEDERFDVVYFSHVLQHTADPAGALAKARRLLSPGGFVVVKTVDDAAKMSYPDPEHAMSRLFDLYERHVLRQTPWTANTDRYFGRKCYTLCRQAGLSNVSAAVFVSDTVGKTLEERLELFERCVYFRRNAPEGTDVRTVRELARAVERFKALFERDDYYFSTSTYLVIGQKLEAGMRPAAYRGAVLGRRCGAGFLPKAEGPGIRPMREEDIGAVMRIELASFFLPWTPLAYLSELRYNEDALYCVAFDEGRVAGYAGAWYRGDGAWITRIAVDPAQRSGGIGRALLADVFDRAVERGLSEVLLEVRASNDGAIAFYRALGFVETERWCGYYTDPADDALVLRKGLG